MAHPAIRDATLSPNKRGADLSDLQAAKRKAHDRQKTDACPITDGDGNPACGLDDLDASGYCRPLVGFANDKKGMMFPLMAVDDKGRRRVSGQVMPVPKDAIYMRISVSYRVYHPTAKLIEPPPTPRKMSVEDQLWMKLTEQSKPQIAAKE